MSSSESMAFFEFAEGNQPYRIEAKVLICGNDIIVICGGGTKYHIGAVSVAISTPSLKDPAKNSATATTVGIPGHKEDHIAREAALRLSKVLKVTSTVTVGIHIDDASPESIQTLVNNFQRIIDQVIERLTSRQALVG